MSDLFFFRDNRFSIDPKTLETMNEMIDNETKSKRRLVMRVCSGMFHMLCMKCVCTCTPLSK